MKNIFRTLFTLILAFVLVAPVSEAQGKKQQKPKVVTIYGSVKSVKGMPLQGVEVTVQDSFTKTETDEFGDFELTTTVGSTIVFSTMYYYDRSVQVNSADRLDVLLEEAPIGLGSKDDIMMGYGLTKKRNVTGSIASVSGDELSQTKKAPIGSGLAGRVMGLTAVTSSGAPGFDATTFRIRGTRTLDDAGQNSESFYGVADPLILVDGFERSFTNLNPDEIESLSVLKDAAATAMYGQKAANGVILVTTKRAKTNKRSIDFKYNFGLIGATDSRPDYVDAYTYAKWYNEARQNDGYDAIYSDSDLAHYKTGDSPLTHPNVDIQDECMHDFTTQHQASLSMSGGNKTARYFASLGYLNQGSLYNTFKGLNEDFQSPSNYSRYNVRSNADVNITKWLTFSMDVAGRIEERHIPSMSSSTLFSTFHIPANQFPLYFYGIDPSLNKEIIMIGGNSVYKTNPLAELAFSGESLQTSRYYQTDAKFHADLSEFITKGLSFEFGGSLDGYGKYVVEKSRSYAVWQYTEDADKNPIYTMYGKDSSLSTSSSFDSQRYYGMNSKLKYERVFGDHAVNAMGFFNYRSIQVYANNVSDYKYCDYGVWASYSFKNKYILEFTGDMSGSDRFYYTKHPYEFLPAVGAAWIVSDEDFLKGKNWLTYLKLKGSYGITGNCDYTFTDRGGSGDERFPARARWWVSTGAQYFGTSLTEALIIWEGRIPNLEIRLEKGNQANIALEGALFKNRLSFDAEVWRDYRTGIYLTASSIYPKMLGYMDQDMPITNDGIVDSKGLELMLDWTDKIGKVTYNVGGYLTATKSKIVEMGEPYRVYDNLIQTGNSVGDCYGLLSDGLFKDQDDINNSPEQLFGTTQPGDIKYKDVNGDGVVDTNDYVNLGNKLPLKNFAFHFGLEYKGFALTAYLQGTWGLRSYISEDSMRAFYNNGTAQYFMENRFHYDENGQSNWATATYPRFTSMANDNNWRFSDYWFYDASYLRLKNVELSYTIPSKMLKKSSIDKARVYLNGNNLFCWSHLSKYHIDAEDHGAGHDSYPITRLFNVGIDLTF